MKVENASLTIVNDVIKQLNTFYNGDPWVTENFSSRILSLNPEEALAKTEGHNHTISQLVGHIAAWTNFAVQKLTGNDEYDIEDNSIVDWPAGDDWKNIRDEFEIAHKKLLVAIRDWPAEKWNAKVPGRNYTFIYLINGLLQHAWYHYGQIGSVLAAVNKKRASNIHL
jgi:uncharacterized damage-inducible protein DinB